MWVQRGVTSLKADGPVPRSHIHTLDCIAGPPPEVLAEVDAAWERAQEPLSFEGLELFFAHDHVLSRVWGELRAADGRTAARMSAEAALALACGDATLVV